VLYRADPRQPLEGDDAIGVLCFFLHQRSDGAIELVNGELEPQLVLLMNNDEQQLVIRAGLQLLRRKELLQAQITGVCIFHLPQLELGRDLGRRAPDEHDLLRGAAEKVVAGAPLGKRFEKFVRRGDSNRAEYVRTAAQKRIGQ
jgi:hypothetical protein